MCPLLPQARADADDDVSVFELVGEDVNLRPRLGVAALTRTPVVG